MPAYRPRELAAGVAEALEEFPVVVVTGLRQCGKTTFLVQDPALRERRYLSLDDLAVLEAARRDPEALVQGQDALTIDEVQRCPELLLAIKRAVDRDRRKGRFLLSGSANFALLKEVSESLAGRALYCTLTPLTRRELDCAEEAPFLTRVMETGAPPATAAGERVTDAEVLAGGMPVVALGETTKPHLWFRGYEQTYLERDLRELSRVTDIVEFRNLMRVVAHRTSCVLNQSEIARDVKLPVRTTARYLGLLEVGFIIERMPPFLRTKASRLIKSPKIVLTDSGLVAHLTDVSALPPDEHLRGPLYETWVTQNLRGILAAHRPDAELCYWSVQGRHEVDLVVAWGRSCLAIEIKASRRFSRDDLKGLEAFLAATPDAVAGLLAYNGEELLPLGDRLFAVPLGVLCS